MARKRTLIITLCVILFVGLNLFLVAKDKSNKVERKTYVKKWEKVIDRDMREFLHKEAKIVASAENQVYMEGDIGNFHEYLVNEGDQVQMGDGIYSYRIQNFFETKTQLEHNIQVLDSEIAAIENAISKIQSSSITTTIIDDELDFSFVNPADELIKDQFIVDKEKELAQKQAQRESLSDQLSELQSSGDVVTVGSPYEGTVKSLTDTLANPIMTIASSNELALEAKLSEEERKIVDTEMPVEITIDDMPDSLSGAVSTLKDFPIEQNEDEDSKGSHYAFTVAFDEDAETDELLPGYHAALKITTNESLQTPTIKASSLNKKTAYKMTNEGTIISQKVELGIQQKKRYEITNGLTAGEFVANEGKRTFKSGDQFITPLKYKKLSYRKIKETNQTLRNKHIILGLLSR